MRGLSDTSLKKNGTLTLITPTFNRQDYLTRLYRSLVAQTNKNFIWMIVDDGSTDDTRNTVEKYIQQYRKNIENGNHEYTESLYKLIKSYKIN